MHICNARAICPGYQGRASINVTRMKKSVAVTELKFGMYVAELDRPWTDTPFIFQGFLLENEQQLHVLKKFCKSVVVDSERAQFGALGPLKPGATRPTPVQVEDEAARAKAAHTDAE